VLLLNLQAPLLNLCHLLLLFWAQGDLILLLQLQIPPILQDTMLVSEILMDLDILTNILLVPQIILDLELFILQRILLEFAQ